MSSGDFPGLDANYGCNLFAGAFTDAAALAAAGTMCTGDIGNMTWLSNWDGNAPVVPPNPGTFVATPTQIAQRLNNSRTSSPPQGQVSFTLGRARVDFGSIGVVSASFTVGPGFPNYVARQWQIAYVPEPASPVLAGAAVAGLSVRRRPVHVSPRAST